MTHVYTAVRPHYANALLLCEGGRRVRHPALTIGGDSLQEFDSLGAGGNPAFHSLETRLGRLRFDSARFI